MKQVLVLMSVTLSSLLLFADVATDQLISELPQGVYKGKLKGTQTDCLLELAPTYSNKDDKISASISEQANPSGLIEPGAKVPLNGHQVITKALVISASTSLVRSTYAYAECCHSGGREEAYIELVDDKLTSVRIEQYVDVYSKGSDIRELKVYDNTCNLNQPIAL